MAFQSGGVVVKGSLTTLWSGNTATWDGWPNSVALGNRWETYGVLYRDHTWVRTVVDKRGRGTARLPLKVYEKADRGRPEAPEHPYARLLRRPNARHSQFFLWLWTSSTYDTYGEVFWAKVRDRGGRPRELLPLHPTAMNPESERDGRTIWTFQNGTVRIEGIPDEDLFHPRNYNPDSFIRGLSPLESLRRTLENEDASRRATSAFWRNGGRPSILLSHPGVVSEAAANRLKVQWDSIHAGADNFGKTAILEEGMKPEIVHLSAEEAQYIEGRRLNREEVCAVYDVPPPVVHILDRATFSNITEQMRSMYRDTMAPHLKGFESELNLQLRDSVRPGASEPDFGDEVYAEFLMDEVLRGDFETRVDSYQKGVNSGWLTPAEVREMENLPFVEGSDRILVNSTMVSLVEEPDDQFTPSDLHRINALAQLIQVGFDPAASLAALGLSAIPYVGAAAPAPVADDQEPALPPEVVRSVMGRLGRLASLADTDAKALTAGLNGHAEIVAAAFNASVAVGESVPVFRDRIRALGHTAKHSTESETLDLLRQIATKEPVINVDARTTVESPPPAVTNVDARTTVEAAKSPDVFVTNNLPEQRAVTKTLTRDADGNIATITEEPHG